ncbi:MAG TPA: DsbA family protein [Gemmatimonadaceae bacterium]|nr:DsbA family protein [Gemmatimonadaceae bacterium]
MPRSNFDRLSTAFTAVLVACALTVTGMMVRREFFPPVRAAAPVSLPPLDVSAQWDELTSHGTVIGSPSAPIRVVEFSDFQCPFCASVQSTLRTLRQRNPSRVAIVFRNYPLSNIHPFARQAATAAACANEQLRFEAYHDKLFAQQDSIGIKPWAQFAKEAGVPDLRAFETCVGRAPFDADVQRDVQLGQRIGVSGTPTIVVQGQMLRAAPTLETIEKMMAAEAPAAKRVSAVPVAAVPPRN